MDVPTAAVEYAAAGWKLVPLPVGGKGPVRAGWNTPEAVISTVEEAARIRHGVGLAHAYSGTCAIDIDDAEQAAVALAGFGVDLAALLSDPASVRIVSGRPGRCKLIYALPVPRRTVRLPGVEFRCATAAGLTVQDVLPPSIHPVTQAPYRWEGADWRALPLLPDSLAAAWDSLLAREDTPPPPPASEEEFPRLRAALEQRNPDCGYDEWIRVGMALHHATGGAEVGLTLWDGWSSGGSKYRGRADLEGHWRSFGRSTGPLVTGAYLGEVAAPEDFRAIEPEEEQKPAMFVPAAELLARPAPKWLIKGVLPAAELAVVYGEAGSGKTFLVLDMVGAITRGEPWFGHRTRQGRVAYICAEGGDFFPRRLAAHETQHGPFRDLWVTTVRPDFLRGDWHKTIAKELKEIEPCLLVVDTLARVMPGGDENSSEHVGAVIAKCEYLHRATGATVLLVHHSGKDPTKGARGWSGLRGAVDAELVVGRDKQTGERWVEVGKQKDAPDGGRIPFALGVVSLGEDEDGDPITSCVVVPDRSKELSA